MNSLVNIGSLEGPDTYKNGIRDDVEIYMNREFELLDEEGRIINDRLLEAYDLEEISYLKKKEVENDNLMKKLISRIEKLESKIQA